MADIMGMIGDALLQALIQALFNTATELLTSAITGLAKQIIASMEGMEGIMGFLSNVMETFVRNMESQLNGLIATAMNAANTQLQETLLVIDAQTALIDKIREETEGITRGLADAMGLELEEKKETGFALTAFALATMAEDETTFMRFAEEYLASAGVDLIIAETNTRERAHALFDYFDKWMAADLQRFENLSDEEAARVADAIMEIAKTHTDLVHEWFMETIVKPSCYGDVFSWAMGENLKIDTDEASESFANIIDMTMHAATDYARKQAEAGGLVPEPEE